MLDGNVKIGYFLRNSPYGKMIVYENGQFSDQGIWKGG